MIVNSDEGKPPANQNIQTLGNILRIKDFKVSGSISDDKGHISLGNFNQPIESGLTKGYSERDIIEGAIQAILPALHFNILFRKQEESYFNRIRKNFAESLLRKNTYDSLPRT